ncbi:hypothetical protein IMZ48_07250 [Candidatus Bathyarchaeota archaeon]|nr:hypothetical protein [Candidatus Bathyarchaeota archaeon]
MGFGLPPLSFGVINALPAVASAGSEGDPHAGRFFMTRHLPPYWVSRGNR